MREHITNGVRVVTLEREPLNTLDVTAIRTLSAMFERQPPDMPLVLAGAGAAFCAGVDAKAFMGYSLGERVGLARAITQMTAALLSIPGPVVAALNGHALGGGLVLALCCDYRVATDASQAKFGVPEARAGIAFPSGPAEIIRQELPPGLLRYMALSCHPVPGARLVEAGVLDELVSSERVTDVAVERAKELAAFPGFSAVKTQVRGGLAARVRELVELGAEPAFEPA